MKVEELSTEEKVKLHVEPDEPHVVIPAALT
jgi:hypothetical protein